MSNDVQHRLVGLLDGILTSLHSLYEDAQDGEELGPGVCLADIDAAVGYLRESNYTADATRLERDGEVLVRNVTDSWFADTAETLSPEEQVERENRYGFPAGPVVEALCDTYRERAGAVAGGMAGWLGKLADHFRAGLEQESPKESRPVDSAVEPRYLFRADGAVYRVRFEGEAGTIARLKGAMYIYEILQHPNRIYPSSELHALGAEPDPKTLRRLTCRAASACAESGYDESGMGGSLVDTGGTAPQADREALRQYHKRLNEIDTEIAGADENSDAAEISRLQREKDIILAEARRGMGLGGKARPKSPNEKARSSVAKAIERVLDNCREKWNLPKLADHLDGHVERGLACSYRPSPSPTPDWQF